MKYNIEAPFTISDEDRSTMESKLESLEKFNLGITSADIFFKEDDGSNPGDIHSQVRVYLPGPDIFAESFHQQAIVAFGNTFDAVKRQALKLKDKRNEHR